MNFFDFLKGTWLGYMIIGLLSFALGITVTLGCLHLIKMRNGGDDKR